MRIFVLYSQTAPQNFIVSLVDELGNAWQATTGVESNIKHIVKKHEPAFVEMYGKDGYEVQAPVPFKEFATKHQTVHQLWVKKWAFRREIDMQMNMLHEAMKSYWQGLAAGEKHADNGQLELVEASGEDTTPSVN